MRAAGQVDVDRLVERDARFEMRRRAPAPAPWCRSRRTCSRRCRCRRRARRGWRSPRRPRPSASIAALRLPARSRRRRRRSAGSARRSGGACRCRSARRASASPRICSAVIRPTGSDDADIAKPGLALRMHADMRRASAPARAARQALERHARQREAPAASRPRRGTRRGPRRSSTYLSRALLRSVRSPCSMKTRTTAPGDRHALLRLQQHAGVAGEVAVAGDAAELQAEIDARRHRLRPRRPRPRRSRCRWCLRAPRPGRRRRRRC